MNKTRQSYLLHSITVGEIETNCYIFGSARTKEVVIIDPGADYEKINKLLDKEELFPRFIVNTHGHTDHIGANHKFKLPIYIHKDDADFLTDPIKSLSAFCANSVMSPKANRILTDGDIIEITDGISLRVLHTPGHTPGGISLHYNGILFTGDTLFNGGVGRTDFPYSNTDELIISIKNKLMVLSDETVVLPGHGERTTIGKERKGNPWL